MKEKSKEWKIRNFKFFFFFFNSKRVTQMQNEFRGNFSLEA